MSLTLPCFLALAYASNGFVSVAVAGVCPFSNSAFKLSTLFSTALLNTSKVLSTVFFKVWLLSSASSNSAIASI